MTKLDIDRVAYFDNASTTRAKPQSVYDSMQYYMQYSINLDRSHNPQQDDVARLVGDTRQQIVQLLGGNRDWTTVLTSTATEALNVVIQGQGYRQGQNIYISPLEHNAVYRTVKYVVDRYQLNLNILPMDDNLQLDWDSILGKWSQSPPHYVFVNHVSNVCGSAIDIDRLGKLCREYGAVYAIDAAQSIGHLDIDVTTCMANYIVFAGHKSLYGHFGCSGFVCRKDTICKPLIYGGVGVDSANEHMPLQAPLRFEAGSSNIVAIAGLHAALQWRRQLGANIRKVESCHHQQLLKILQASEIVDIVGSHTNNHNVVSCTIKRLPVDSAGQVLASMGVVVRTGLHCAPLAHKFLGTFPSGTVRLSASYWTTQDDFEMLRQALIKIEGELL
jgi:selenocysteine lyase/cysteine desulfurase